MPNLLPSGAPGVAPELDQRDVCLLLATLMSAPKLDEAVDHARAYRTMTPGGAVLSADAPDSIPRSALEYLEVQSEIAIGSQTDDVRGHHFEFVHGWRELSAHTREGTVTRFVLPGTLASHQQAPGLRVAVRRRRKIMDMTTLRSEALVKASAVTEAMLCEVVDAAEIMNSVRPPAEIAPQQLRLWQDLLVQSIQRHLLTHNVTV